ncbi:hypothetical protein CsSME_00035779 [Camellia sinensis var. sinensis]
MKIVLHLSAPKRRGDGHPKQFDLPHLLAP